MFDPTPITPEQWGARRQAHTFAAMEEFHPDIRREKAQWERERAKREAIAEVQRQIANDTACLSVAILTQLTAIHFNCEPLEIMGKNRSHPLPQARAVVARLLRDQNRSYPEISAMMGMGSHSSAICAVKRARREDVYAVKQMMEAAQ